MLHLQHSFDDNEDTLQKYTVFISIKVVLLKCIVYISYNQ